MKYILQGILLFVLLFAGKTMVNAQDESVQSHYILNPEFVNTGATGFQDAHKLRFNFRNHWSGFEGSPNNYLLSYSGRVGNHDGIGLMLGTESYNAISRHRAKLSYAYNFRLGDVDLGMGLGVKYQQEVLKSSAYTGGGIDPDDPIINELMDGAQYLGADFGIYGAYKDSWTFGVGVPDLFRSRLDKSIVADSLKSSTLFKYYSVHVGYMFHSKQNGIMINPSIMLRNSFRYTTELDLNLLATFMNGGLVTGVTYTVGGRQRVAAMLGGRINNFSLAYSYDISLRDFQQYNGGSHELTIGVDISNLAPTVKSVED